MCGALRDLVLFVQFKKREKPPWRSVNFSNRATHLISLRTHNYKILSFSSPAECFIFRSTQGKRVYPMKFILIKLLAYIVQTATLLYTNFTTYTFWSVFWKLAILKRYILRKKSMVYQRLNKVVILPKRELTVDLVEEALKIPLYSQENLFGTNSTILSKTLQHNSNHFEYWKEEWK